VFRRGRGDLHSSQSGMPAGFPSFLWNTQATPIPISHAENINVWAKLSQGYLDPISPPELGITVLLVQRLSDRWFWP